MKGTITIVLTVFFGLVCHQSMDAQLGKLGKKVSNKIKTEERKAKKVISNTEKTGKLPKTTGTTIPDVKTPTTGNSTSTPNVRKNAPAMPSVSGGEEAACKNTESYFKLARKDLAKIMNSESDAESRSIADLEGILKRIKEYWKERILIRDESCDTSKLDAEIHEAKNLIEDRKANATFLKLGRYATTGIWENIEFGAMNFTPFTNEQAIKLNGPLGNYEGKLMYKSTEAKPEAVSFDIDNFGQGIIQPINDVAGNTEYHQMAVVKDEKPIAMILFSDTKSRAELEKIIENQVKERIEKENLDPFVENNLGKILVSTQGPIFANGKVGGKDGASEIKLTQSIELGQDVWVRVFVKDNKPPMYHLAFTGFPPSGEGGAAISTKIYFDGEEVGKDLFIAVMGDDPKITNEWKSYREPFFEQNGPAQNAYREGIEGIFSKNPKVGAHELRIKKYVVNHNVSDPSGNGEYPLETEISDSGPIKVTITENSWKSFCNSGSSNYAPSTGAVNELSKSLLAVVKQQAVKEGWAEKPRSAVHTKSVKVYHEISGVHLHTEHWGFVQSFMQNGARLEQGFMMKNRSYYGTDHGTQRYLPPNCN